MHRTWTIRMSNTEPKGYLVWKGCPFVDGTEVYLHVVDLPLIALRIGDYRSRNPQPPAGAGPLGLQDPPLYVNGPLLGLGPWPGDSWPLTVGCNLSVIPAWEIAGGPIPSSVIHASMPEPTTFSNEGVDCRGLDEVHVWAGLGTGAPDEVRVFVWVRHPSGFWAQPAGSTAPASLPASSRIIVNTEQADRVYAQIVWTTPAITDAWMSYGILSAPPTALFGPGGAPYETKEPLIRFGAIEATPGIAK